MARKLSDYKGEEALLLMADILEPALVIMQDEELVAVARAGDKPKAIKIAIKNHTSEVMEILAIYNGISVDAFREQCNIASLPVMAMEIMSDKELIGFFTSQAETVGETVSGGVLESTTETETPKTS